MNIALDMMGGDYAPLEAVKGIQKFVTGNQSSEQVTLQCIGDEEQIRPLLTEFDLKGDFIQVIHTSEVIGYHDSPTTALREKPNSSIVIGLQNVANGKSDAFISAGNTGAMLVGSMFIIKPSEGVQRPTLPSLIPKLNGEMGLMLDVGLNTDCKPQHLEQFALLGSLYAKHILNIEDPKVGLLNIGEEESKGNTQAQAVYPLLKVNPQINFIGNVEGRHIIKDIAHVIVCDGFTGNIVLKMLESIYDLAVSRHFEKDFIFQKFDYENYGGTPILGVAKPVIIGHGISNDQAFSSMISLAEKMISSRLCEKIAKTFSQI